MDSSTPIYHVRLRQLLDYWQGLPRHSRLPSRTAIDPVEIPSLLANIMLVDVEGSPRRFRCRLVGSAIVDFVGHNCKGCLVEDMGLNDGEDRDARLRDFHAVVEKREPVCARRSVTDLEGRKFLYERMLLPLASDGETVDCLLGGMYFDEQPIKVPRLRGLA